MFFVARSTNRTDSSLNTTKYDSKVAKRIMLIVATDCICWMPIFLLGILSLIGWYPPPQVSFLIILEEKSFSLSRFCSFKLITILCIHFSSITLLDNKLVVFFN